METVNQSTIVEAIRGAAAEVFSTMLALELEVEEPFTETVPSAPSEGVVSLVGLAGAWVGTGSLSCSAQLACQISSQMLMTELTAVDGEVLDAVAEVTNMIIGNVKTVLEADLGPMGLSIPTVVFGKNFTTRGAGNGQWIVLPFRCGEERMEIRVCIEPSRQVRLSAPGFSQSFTVQP